MRAIQMTEFGGPEVLQLAELPQPEPGPGEVLIRVTRAGLNFADTHTRTNSYVRKATLPLVPGGEVAGVPRGHRRARRGAGRRAAATPSTRSRRASSSSRSPTGSTTAPRWRCSSRGTTAWHLLPHRRAACADGESVVVHSAAGGVGSLAVQLGAPARAPGA